MPVSATVDQDPQSQWQPSSIPGGWQGLFPRSTNHPQSQWQPSSIPGPGGSAAWAMTWQTRNRNGSHRRSRGRRAQGPVSPALVPRSASTPLRTGVAGRLALGLAVARTAHRVSSSVSAVSFVVPPMPDQSIPAASARYLISASSRDQGKCSVRRVSVAAQRISAYRQRFA